MRHIHTIRILLFIGAVVALVAAVFLSGEVDEEALADNQVDVTAVGSDHQPTKSESKDPKRTESKRTDSKQPDTKRPDTKRPDRNGLIPDGLIPTSRIPYGPIPNGPILNRPIPHSRIPN